MPHTIDNIPAPSSAKSFMLIFKLFQLFYLAPIALTKTSKPTRYVQKLFCFIIFVLWVINVLYILRAFWIDQIQFHFTYIATIGIISIAYCLTIIESLVHHNRQIKILNCLTEIDGLLEMEPNALKATIIVQRKYLAKVYGSFMCVVVCQLVGTVFRASVIDWNEYGFGYAKFGLCLRLAQIGFHVDMLYERLRQANRLLVAVQNERDHSRIVASLYLTRKLYGKLWTICCEINQTFGNSLAIINVEFMFDMVNTIYLLYDYVMQSTELAVGK